MSKRQKTLFSETEPDGDIEYIGQKLPGDFADSILLEPEELAELGDGEELFTLEDDPDPWPGIDHSVEDVRNAMRYHDHLQFLTDDRLLCGTPVKLGPNGPDYDLHLVNVFEWVGQPPQWQPTNDIVLSGLLLPEDVQ